MAAGGLYGDGTIFELSGASHFVFTTLISFTGNSGSDPGNAPFAGLTMDGNGNLFGTTTSGGTYGDGTVFELAVDHTTFSSLVSFTGSAGAYPGQNASGKLSLDSSGNLFGTTVAGGTSGKGTKATTDRRILCMTVSADRFRRGSWDSRDSYTGFALKL